MHSDYEMRRFTLTHKQKQRIRDEVDRRRQEGRSVEQKEIAQWAKEKLRLPSTPSQPVLSRLLSSKLVLPLTKTNMKRQRFGAQPQIEESLVKWVRAQYDARICINGELIRKQGARLLDSVNALLPPGCSIEFKFSKGWLYDFQRRWKIKARKAYGEAGDADDEGIANSITGLQQMVSEYSMADIWNADETGLNYSMPPDRTISERPMPGRKKCKDRLTFLFCANALGTERMPPMIIGKAKKPRAFNKKTGQQLGFDYWNNKKSWMTSSLFFEWLRRFNEFIARTNGRKVLLLIDNCSAHGTEDSIPKLSNVAVKFLPANTTSKLQPLDAGIIAAWKVRYRKMQYERALDLLQDEGKNIYKVDQLTAMKYGKALWNDLPSAVLFNCWRTTGLLDAAFGVRHTATASDRESGDEVAELQETINSLVPAPARMSIANLLNCDSDDRVETADLDVLAQAVVDSMQDDYIESDSESGEETTECWPPIADQLRALALCMRLIERQDEPNFRLLKGLRRIKRNISSAQSQLQTQTRIDAYFNKA